MKIEDLLKLSETHPELALTKAIAAITIMKEALERIPALTHSWIIAEQTMYCKHTYGEIRAEAKKALKQIEEL